MRVHCDRHQIAAFQKDSMAIRTRPNNTPRSLFEPSIVKRALRDAFVKLDPRKVAKNPVMFVVEITSAMTTFFFVRGLSEGAKDTLFVGQVSLWLWFTVLFANFAEAMAEGRGKAQADALRRTKTDTPARRLVNGREESVAAPMLAKGDMFVCEAGDVIAADGEIVEGIASVDESAITGESAPVIRESGGDRSAVTGGTKVLSDRIVVRVTQDPGQSFLDRMIALVEGAKRQKTPNEIALSILLAGLTIVFLFATVTLLPFAKYAAGDTNNVPSITVLVALLVCLIPTTIGGLLSAIGIAGMDRVMQHNVLAMSGKAVEAAGDVNTLLLDKTGTITLGNRQATAFHAAPGVSEEEVADTAQLASLADETPEGRSIVVLAKDTYGIRGREIHDLKDAQFIEFTAQTRMSGIEHDGHSIRKGAADSLRNFVEAKGGHYPPEVQAKVEQISREGGTPLVVADDARVLGDDPGNFDGINDLAKAYRDENGLTPDAVLPADAVTRSASGLDPDISPANAELQAPRVAKARGITVDKVKQLINDNISGRFAGLYGEPRVNVLKLNLALDQANH
jgi:potassium-transporting ATPase ATP-binding subunit